MGTPTAATEERRRQIMQAALPVFAEKGFKGATNRDIAERAGIAPGLIYHYFKNKEDLFSAIIDEFLPVSRVTLPLESMTEVPPVQLLPLLVHGLSGILQEGHFFLVMRILIAETMYAPEQGHRVNAIFKALIDPFTVYLQAQIARGHLRDADPLLMAQSFFASIGVFYLRRSIGMDETLLTYDPAQLANFVTDSFLRAYAPDPPTP
jgi:AcrR family transcriptional regulator